MDLKEAVKVLNRHHHRMEPHAQLRWVAGDCGCRPAAFPLAFLKHDSKEEHDDSTLTPFEAIAIAMAYKNGMKRKDVDRMREIRDA